ncbi:hypothetical protein, partial [Rothia sp. CCM 9416]|uniref:hypothetical protein n=1 Tax=Rothia sp. CCM 9416 TaxID=3402655 RepID=UPI003AE698D3
MDSYEPLSPENLVNPYPAYEWLRSLPGLYWHEGMQSYVASRYVDCKKVLSDNRYFAKDRRRIGQDIPPERMSIQTEDPPNRLGLRQDFRKSIHSLDLSSICEESGERFESRLLSHTGKFDFVEEVSRISALDMTSSIFGLSEEQVNDYFKLNLDLTRGLDAGLDPARLERGIQAG